MSRELEALATAQISLGLGTEGLQLRLPVGALAMDSNPILLDTCMASISELGHRDSAPRPYDWENLLPLLQPGEELLWIVDYSRGESDRDREHVRLSLALRFNRTQVNDPRELEQRRSRFEAMLGQFRRQAFPESQVSVLPPGRTWEMAHPPETASGATTWCVVGTPSPKVLADTDAQAGRMDEAAVFQSLNDVVESCLHLRRFRIVSVVGRASEREVDQMLASVTELRDRLHPMLEAQHAATRSEARTWMEQEGDSSTESLARSEQDDAVNRMVRWAARLVGGAKAGRGQTYRWESAPGQRSEGRTTNRSSSSGGQTVDGTTVTSTRIASGLQLADESLDRYARALYQARATGGYRGAVLVQADEGDARLVADALRGVLSGARSKDRPLTLAPVRGDTDRLLLSNTPVLDLLAPAPPILTDDQAGQLLLLPEAELPGLRMHRSVFLGRNARPADTTHRAISLGRFAFSGRSSGVTNVEIASEDLYRHLLVCGTTGSGKTRRVVSVLNGMQDMGEDVRIVVFETAKRTYRSEFRRTPDRAPQIFTVGDSAANPLRMNPFYFESGTSLKRHISVVADALSDLMPTEALIGPKMREAVERAYIDAGWNIETGRSRGDGEAAYPTVIEFIAMLRQVASELKHGGEVASNYRGALEGRARVFLDATFQDIFSHDGNQSVDELFDRDTIIELEGLPSSEIDLPAFLLSLLLERLRSHQTKGSTTRWIVVVEEAHNVLPREAEAAGSSGEARGGHTLVKNIVRLLQEGRELGIGVVVVDQAPTLLARSVLKNANTKIVMRLEDGEEIAEMGQALGLPEVVWPDLGLLRQGEAVIKASYMAQPVKSSRFEVHELPPSHVVTLPPQQPPDYAGLEALWAQVIAGRTRPDTSWMDSLQAASNSNGELIRFGLGRALLRDDTPPKASLLLRSFCARPTDLQTLQTIAEQLYVDQAGSRARRQLVPVQRLLLAAATAQIPAGPNPTVAAIDSAAAVLARTDDDRTRWRNVLAALVRGNTSPLERQLEGRPPLDACIRLGAILARPDARHALNGTPFDPLALILVLEQSIEPVLEGLAPVEPSTRDQLLSGIARVLVRSEHPENTRILESWLGSVS